MKKAPALRFKGFTNDWEQRKLGDISEIIRGASPRPISDPKWFNSNSNIGWLRISDVTAQHGRIQHLSQHISILGQAKTRVISTPHLLLSIAASVGYPVINYVKTGVHDGFLIFENPKFNIDFGFYWLAFYKHEWQKFGQPGSQVNLNSSIVKKTNIGLPDNVEQKAIVHLLKLIDNCITLQQRKLKDIQLLKKAYLKAIFKSNKSTYKLKDIADYRRGSFPQPYGNPKWYGGDGSLPFVQVIDVAKNLRLYNSTKQRISRLAQSKSVFVPKGSILITLQGSIGKVAITQYDAFVDRTLLIISNLKKDVDKYYFAYALQDKFNEEKRKAPGGTIKTITKNALSEFQIKLPKKDIQKKQSSILQKIDKDIYIINLKLSELSKFKQFLLQNMFI